MNQARIDELQEILRQKTEPLRKQIEQAEEEFAKAIEEEKNMGKEKN